MMRHSMPLMRGEPSRRSVAIVRCLFASNSSRASFASSGAASTTSVQLAIAGSMALKPCARPPMH